MSTQFAALHIEKGKGSGGGLGAHLDRSKSGEHTFPNADRERMQLNQNIVVNEFCTMPLPKAINACIEQGYMPGVAKKKAIRKDAVRWCETLLHGSHEQLTNIKNDATQLQQWIEANLEFVKKEFGEKNICRFSVHLDERTPHIHVVHVPLTKCGRLSAKEVMGDQQAFIDRQSRYAEAMQPFDLQRGVRGSKARHETIQEYYARLNQTMATTEATKPKEYDRASAVWNTNTINQQLQDLHGAVLAARLELDKKERRLAVLERTSKDKDIEIEKQKLGQLNLMKEKQDLQKGFNLIVKDLQGVVKKQATNQELSVQEQAIVQKQINKIDHTNLNPTLADHVQKQVRPKL